MGQFADPNNTQQTSGAAAVGGAIADGVTNWANANVNAFTGAVDQTLGTIQNLASAPGDFITGIMEGDIAGVTGALTNISGVVGIVLKSRVLNVTYDSDGIPTTSTNVSESVDNLVNLIRLFLAVDLSSVTSAVSNIGLNSIVSTGTTMALNAAIGSVGERLGQYTNLADLTPDGASDSAVSLINQFANFSSNDGDITSAVSELTGIDAQTAINAASSLSTDITNIQNRINAFKNRVDERLSGTDNTLGLTQRVAQKNDPNIKTIEARLLQTINTSQSALEPPFQIGSNVAEWQVADKTTIEFSYINTLEELRADINAITRPITGVVVHWTKHFSNQNIGSEEINKDKIGLGEDGIQYHYVIRRDGSLQRGRPTGLSSNHTTKRNHNIRSLGIAFVGGYNCPTQTENPDKYLSSRSLTQAQFATFEKFCLAFYSKYPGGQIIGHNDLDTDFIDPGFDVRDYVEDIFNKKSLFADPTVGNAFEPEELNRTVLP